MVGLVCHSMAAAKGDLPHVVLLFGMAGPKQIDPMRPDVEVCVCVCARGRGASR